MYSLAYLPHEQPDVYLVHNHHSEGNASIALSECSTITQWDSILGSVWARTGDIPRLFQRYESSPVNSWKWWINALSKTRKSPGCKKPFAKFWTTKSQNSAALFTPAWTMYEKGILLHPTQQRPVIAYKLRQSKSTTKYLTIPVTGSAHPQQLNISPPLSGFSSPNTKCHGGICLTINELSPTKDIVISKFVNGNFVEFPHAALEREDGLEPFSNDHIRHKCASINGQAICIVPQSKLIIKLPKMVQIEDIPV
jgi:hypothetical protein